MSNPDAPWDPGKAREVIRGLLTLVHKQRTIIELAKISSNEFNLLKLLEIIVHKCSEVVDAETGSILLMDATGAYHRQMTQQYEGSANSKHIITPLMRLQDADMTHVVIVTLPEVTPVSQAAALQDDLRRAHIEPWAWVINKSMAATGTSDPLLQARLVGEQQQAARIANGLAQRTYVLPWLATPPVGVAALGQLASAPPATIR